MFLHVILRLYPANTVLWSVTHVDLYFITCMYVSTIEFFSGNVLGVSGTWVFLWWNYERVYVGIGLNPEHNDPWRILCLNPILSSPVPPWELSIKMEIYSNHKFWFKNIDETLYAMTNVIYSLYHIFLFTLFYIKTKEKSWGAKRSVYFKLT